jgi:ADP-ribosylglycohydrolase
MRESQLYQKVYGCLLGGAIGDAFGIRVEMMHYRDIERQYGRLTDFDPMPCPRPGWIRLSASTHSLTWPKWPRICAT